MYKFNLSGSGKILRAKFGFVTHLPAEFLLSLPFWLWILCYHTSSAINFMFLYFTLHFICFHWEGHLGYLVRHTARNRSLQPTSNIKMLPSCHIFNWHINNSCPAFLIGFLWISNEIVDRYWILGWIEKIKIGGWLEKADKWSGKLGKMEVHIWPGYDWDSKTWQDRSSWWESGMLEFMIWSDDNFFGMALS